MYIHFFACSSCVLVRLYRLCHVLTLLHIIMILTVIRSYLFRIILPCLRECRKCPVKLGEIFLAAEEVSVVIVDTWGFKCVIMYILGDCWPYTKAVHICMHLFISEVMLHVQVHALLSDLSFLPSLCASTSSFLATFSTSGFPQLFCILQKHATASTVDGGSGQRFLQG